MHSLRITSIVHMTNYQKPVYEKLVPGNWYQTHYGIPVSGSLRLSWSYAYPVFDKVCIINKHDLAQSCRSCKRFK